jgi:hypothetical protein
MKKTLFFLLLFATAFTSSAQSFEWRLGKVVFNNVDPDGVGPAKGQVKFTLQIHTTSGTVDNITQISTGFSYQSANAMIPSNPGCAIAASTPANITMSADFAAVGFAYTVVNQCNPVSPAINTGSQEFDRRANGTIDNGSISIGTTWTDVFTVTLWTLSGVTQGGYVIINSSEGGSLGEYTTYSISDISAQQYASNSLTYATPLALSSSILPVDFVKFDAQCSPAGNNLTWTTASEKDNAYFDVQKSTDGSTWTSIGRVNGAGSSNSTKTYQFTDHSGGTAQYRIKQVDNNGAVAYSSIVRTSCSSSSFYVKLYPIPARDKLTLVVNLDKAVKSNVYVVDNNGRVVMSLPLTMNKGVNNFTLDVSHLSQGQYYLQSTAEEVKINHRFTITR